MGVPGDLRGSAGVQHAVQRDRGGTEPLRLISTACRQLLSRTARLDRRPRWVVHKDGISWLVIDRHGCAGVAVWPPPWSELLTGGGQRERAGSEAAGEGGPAWWPSLGEPLLGALRTRMKSCVGLRRSSIWLTLLLPKPILAATCAWVNQRWRRTVASPGGTGQHLVLARIELFPARSALCSSRKSEYLVSIVTRRLPPQAECRRVSRRLSPRRRSAVWGFSGSRAVRIRSEALQSVHPPVGKA